MYPPAGRVQRVIQAQRGFGYCVSGQSGIIAAALAQDSVVFAMRCALQAVAAGTDPNAQKQAVLSRLRFALTTITAFTTPVTAGRRFSLHRASNAGAEISAQTLLVPVKRDSRAPATIVTPIRIANTAGITVGGLTVETDPIAVFDISHSGAAGGRAEFELTRAQLGANPEVLNPGQYLVLKNPVAMDAAGTLNLTIIDCEFHEQRADESGL